MVFVSMLAFVMKHSWSNIVNLSFSFDWGIVVQRVEKSNIVMLLHEEMDLEIDRCVKCEIHVSDL